MVFKMFGRGMKHGSPGEQILKILRVAHEPKVETPASCASAECSEDPQQLMGYNTQGYAVYDRRMREVETEKAMVLRELRHERWKASGPN